MALSCQNRYEQAVEAYKKALELEPNQESYRNNLKIAEDKVKELNQARSNAPVFFLATLNISLRTLSKVCLVVACQILLLCLVAHK